MSSGITFGRRPAFRIRELTLHRQLRGIVYRFMFLEQPPRRSSVVLHGQASIYVSCTRLCFRLLIRSLEWASKGVLYILYVVLFSWRVFFMAIVASCALP